MGNLKYACKGEGEEKPRGKGIERGSTRDVLRLPNWLSPVSFPRYFGKV